jgi:hypothetical protein
MLDEIVGRARRSALRQIDGLAQIMRRIAPTRIAIKLPCDSGPTRTPTSICSETDLTFGR